MWILDVISGVGFQSEHWVSIDFTAALQGDSLVGVVDLGMNTPATDVRWSELPLVLRRR